MHKAPVGIMDMGLIRQDAIGGQETVSFVFMGVCWDLARLLVLSCVSHIIGLHWHITENSLTEHKVGVYYFFGTKDI